MTYIPGTGPINSVNQNPLEEPKKQSKEEIISTVNVYDLKNPDEKEYVEEDKIWYNQLKYWLIGGGFLSFIFAIFAFWNWKSLFLLPLGPYVAYLAWYARKWSRKHTKNFDVLR